MRPPTLTLTHMEELVIVLLLDTPPDVACAQTHSFRVTSQICDFKLI